MLYATPWQTVGPFLHIGLTWLNSDELADEGVAGERIEVQGRVVDGRGEPMADAMLELWQADALGRYADAEAISGFRGFGRVPTGADGTFAFRSIKPGRVPGPHSRLQAPHINVSLFARGILRRLTTRIYFADEASNADDPVLQAVPQARRGTLLARGEGGRYRFDIVAQGTAAGPPETVFFDI